MDLTQLRTFIAVAEERHLTRAAERLHLSQPAASAHIRGLEEALGVILFERSNRGLELTAAGLALVERARQVTDGARAMVAYARELHGQASGTLKLGSNADPELSRIADIVAHLRADHPLVMLDIHTQSSATALQGVRSGELDASLLLGEPLSGSLGCLTLCRVKYRIAGPAGWADTLRDADWEAIARLPWITADPGNSYMRMLDRLFGDKGLRLNSVAQANNATLIRFLISAGVGLCLMREDQALAAQARGAMSLSDIAVPETTLMFVYPHSREHDPALAALRAAVQRIWNPPEKNA